MEDGDVVIEIPLHCKKRYEMALDVCDLFEAMVNGNGDPEHALHESTSHQLEPGDIFIPKHGPLNPVVELFTCTSCGSMFPRTAFADGRMPDSCPACGKKQIKESEDALHEETEAGRLRDQSRSEVESGEDAQEGGSGDLQSADQEGTQEEVIA